MAKRWELPAGAELLPPEEGKAVIGTVGAILQAWMWAAKNYATLQILLDVLSHMTGTDLASVDKKSEEILDDFQDSLSKELDVKSHWEMSELLQLANQVFEECFERSLKGKPIQLKPMREE